MTYKSMVLELIQQRSDLCEELTSSSSLISTVEQLAMRLRARHQELTEHLRQTQPHSAEVHLKSEAMEIAAKELKEVLFDESPENDEALPLT